jgi:hypothetical protein
MSPCMRLRRQITMFLYPYLFGDPAPNGLLGAFTGPEGKRFRDTASQSKSLSSSHSNISLALSPVMNAASGQECKTTVIEPAHNGRRESFSSNVL